MNQIVKVGEDRVSIGTADGGIIEVRTADLSFTPQVGDKVNVFKNELEIIVTKIEEAITKSVPDGININITNENASNNSGAGTGVYVQGGKVVNKVAYVLCAMLLGGFGIHKFISGKIGMGILYIVFSWTFIPSFVAFIEGIIAIFKTSDSNGNIVV